MLSLGSSSRLPEPPRPTRKRIHLLLLLLLIAMAAVPRGAEARRDEQHMFYPSLHFQVGAATSVGPAPLPEDSVPFPLPGEPRLAMDLRLSAPAVLPHASSTVTPAEMKESNNVVLLPEVGYGYQRGERHLFLAGLGVGVGSYWRGFGAYLPRLVVGKDNQDLALGLRHGVAARLLRETFAVELAHQALHTRGAWQHDILVMFGIVDPVNLLGNAGAYLFKGF